MSEFAFTISLKDLITAPARRMQSSLIGTQKSLLASSQDALSLERSMKSLEGAMVKSAATGNVAAYQKQRRELEALKVAMDQTDTSSLKLAREIGAQAKEIGESSEKTAELAERMTAIYEVGTELAKKIGETALELGEFTVEAVQSKQAAQSMFAAMAGGTEKGNELFEMVEDLAGKLPETKEQLEGFSKTFTAMGVLDTNELRSDLIATTSAVALMGDTGGSAFETIKKKITEAAATTGKLKLADKQLAGLAATGVNVADVAGQMGMSAKSLEEKLKKGAVSATAFGSALNAALIQKGAGPLERMSGSLTTLQQKFKESIADIFEDVDITPFTGALKDLLGVFNQNTASGQTMKVVMTGLFGSIFSLAGKALVAVKHLFLGAIILGLKAYIAIKPWIPLLKILGEVVLVAGAAFLFTFTPAIVGAIVALGGLIATAAIAAAPFLAIGVAVVGVYEAFTHWTEISALLSKTGKEITEWVTSVAKRFDQAAAEFATWAVEAGVNLVTGLISGIANKAGELVGAVKGLAKKAIGSFKGALGIASDSKEFIKLGRFTGSGYVTGLRATQGLVGSTAGGLADVANDNAAARVSKSVGQVSSSAASAAAPAPASSSGGGVTVNIAPGAIVINGAQGDVTELTEHAVSLIFEKIALSQGVAA